MANANGADFDAAAAIYERAEINGRLGFGSSPGLLVVDFSYGSTDPESPLGSDMTDAVLATSALVRDCRAAGLPIIFTVHAYRPDLADLGVWGDKYPGLRHLTTGSRWTTLDERLGVRAEDVVIHKQYPSAFFGTIVSTHLTSRGVDCAHPRRRHDERLRQGERGRCHPARIPGLSRQGLRRGSCRGAARGKSLRPAHEVRRRRVFRRGPARARRSRARAVLTWLSSGKILSVVHDICRLLKIA